MCTTTWGWRWNATSMRTSASWGMTHLIWSWPSNPRFPWRKSRWQAETRGHLIGFSAVLCPPLWQCRFPSLSLCLQFMAADFGDDKASASDSSSRLSCVDRAERNSRALSLHNSITKSKGISFPTYYAINCNTESWEGCEWPKRVLLWVKYMKWKLLLSSFYSQKGICES